MQHPLARLSARSPFDALRLQLPTGHDRESSGRAPRSPPEPVAPETHLRMVCPRPDCRAGSGRCSSPARGTSHRPFAWGGRTKIERPFTAGVERLSVSSWVTRAAGIGAIDQSARRLVRRREGRRRRGRDSAVDAASPAHQRGKTGITR